MTFRRRSGRRKRSVADHLGLCSSGFAHTPRAGQAKEHAGDLLTIKSDLESEKRKLEERAAEKEVALQRKLKTIGNYVHDSVPISNDEVGVLRQRESPMR